MLIAVTFFCAKQESWRTHHEVVRLFVTMPRGDHVHRSNWPIIIGGCYRSGTSLLRRVLNSHSRIHCGPEVKFFRDFYGHYFDDPLSHLRFMHSARSLLPELELFDLLGRAFVVLHETAAMRARKPRWADKNPENVLYLAEWRRLLGDQWVFVHVVRNPLDTLASIKERSFPLSIPGSLQERIEFYCRYLQVGLAFAEANPSTYFRVQYERLVKSPETELRCLMRWLGENLEPVQMDFNSTPHLVGLEDPKIASTSRIHSDSAGRWMRDLTVDESQLIWSHTKELWRIVDPEERFEM
jgi:Sulfotransferase family